MSNFTWGLLLRGSRFRHKLKLKLNLQELPTCTELEVECSTELTGSLGHFKGNRSIQMVFLVTHREGAQAETWVKVEEGRSHDSIQGSRAELQVPDGQMCQRTRASERHIQGQRAAPEASSSPQSSISHL
jgi:hypothetical protein